MYSSCATGTRSMEHGPWLRHGCPDGGARSDGQLVWLPAFSCRGRADPVVAAAGARPVARQSLAAELAHEHVHVLGDDVLDDEQLPGVAWGATARGTYSTAEAGTRTPYVQYVGPWGQAALRLRYVPNAGGWYV